MKRLASVVIALCVFLGLSAQENNTFRFGYLSYEQALKSVPQYAIMEKQLADLEAQYQAETKRVEDEFNRKYEEFLEGQREFPKTILQKRQVELQELMEKNIAFKEESRQQLASAEEEALAPLKAHLSEAIAKVAKEHGLAFVVNTDSNAYPFIDPTIGEDINTLVQNALK
ncbi:MAG: OmpH family outer membrane protein [Prevotella sp.]|nr:OmpH family outer membrane protein [Prevotella sp.]